MSAANGHAVGPIVDAGWELLREREVRARVGDRVWALETAYGRRLLRHNAGPGPAACECEECRWLRTLIDDDLPARLRAETERIAMMTGNLETFARQRLAEVERERAEIDQQIESQIAALRAKQRDLVAEEKATRAAIAAYERAIAAPSPAKQKRRSSVDAPAGDRSPRAWLRTWALAHGGEISVAEATAAAVLAGMSAGGISWAVRTYKEYERIERGVYRLLDEPAA